MLKRIFEKYIGQLLILVTVVGLALFAYSYYRDQQENRKYANLIGTKEKYEQLSKYVGKLESDYKSQSELLKRVNSEWAEINKSKDERIKLLSDATYLISKHIHKQNGPDYYFETPKRSKNYVLNEIRIDGENSPPIGYILIKSDGRTYKRGYEYEIVVKNLQTIDESTGKVKVYAKAFLVMKEKSPLAKRVKDYKDWKDQPYELEITGGTALVDPTMPDLTKRFYFWSPHLNTGFSIGANLNGAFMRPVLDFSVMGFGLTKNDLSWKFLHLGFDVDTQFQDPGFHLMPFSYRFWPSLLTNTYIGPAVGISRAGFNGQFILNLSL